MIFIILYTFLIFLRVRVKIKVEQDDDVMEIENPELHFTTIDGDCSTLESGYQLLNSLEAVTKYALLYYCKLQ